MVLVSNVGQVSLRSPLFDVRELIPFFLFGIMGISAGAVNPFSRGSGHDSHHAPVDVIDIPGCKIANFRSLVSIITTASSD